MNKRILLLLFERGFLKPEIHFIDYLMTLKDLNGFNYCYYLYGGLKKFIHEDEKRKQIENEISKNYEENIDIFEKKCQIGENNSYICSLIRNDSIEEFISYVNQNNYPLTNLINPSIYETHSFLIENKTTLIEYAAFFGSIQIIRYLQYNQVPLTGRLWLYAIHSNNSEIIEFLITNKVKPEDISYNICLKESIKCHHNDITNYIIDNLLSKRLINDKNKNGLSEIFDMCIVRSENYSYFPSILDMISKLNTSNDFSISQLHCSFTTITLPSSVDKIGNNIFEYCYTLETITIPSSIIFIGKNAFNGCKSLKEIIFAEKSNITLHFNINSDISNNSLFSIGDNAFSNCSSLTQISIPPLIKTINNGAFQNCSKLEQISIPSSVISIGDYAFHGCTLLKKIILTSSITSIGNYAFTNCHSLEEIHIPSSVIYFGMKIFDGVISIIIKGDLAYIPKNLFKENKSLKQIKILLPINSIETETFYKLSSLERIVIPSSVISIEERAFSGCSSLKEISIPSSVTSIGYCAFESCSSLKQITIPSSVTSIESYVFSGCSSLTQISIPSTLKIDHIGLYSNIKICRYS